MSMKVLKFGGSSVAKPERIQSIANIIKGYPSDITIVFSAFGGVTDQLIEMATLAASGDEQYKTVLTAIRDRHVDAVTELIEPSDLRQQTIERVEQNFEVLSDLLTGVFLVREASPRTMDYVLSFGECNSAYIISQYFNAINIEAHYVDARDIIKTNKEFGNARVNFKKTNKCIGEYFDKKKSGIKVVTGFIAADKGGLTTTLGRGGSDYTAAILSAALDAEVLEIWTDVDGVLTSNPRVVENAYTIPELSYDEAMELSHFGAKVIYPPTIQPALSKNIPIYIKNTFNPSFIGTRISDHASKEGRKKITGVTSVSDIVLMTVEGTGMMGVPGTAARLFSCLATVKVNIVMITQASSEHSICFAIKPGDLKKAQEAIQEEFAKEIEGKLIKSPRIEKELSLVAVIGEKMKSVPGLAGSLFRSLGKNGINIIAIAQGSSELNITFAIEKKDEQKALNLVHDAFFLSESTGLNLFLMGTGLIGSTLIKQIKAQHDQLLKERHIDIQIIGVSNSRKMYFDNDGIDLSKWDTLLDQDGEKASVEGFIEKMKGYNYANSIFIDCTANGSIPDHYHDILSSAISISTANKVGASSAYAQYHQLEEVALANNAQYLFETNVGAGLPVLSTLSGLVNSGDRVKSIQAVISGSLSYIFNNYSPDRKFKDLIMEARQLGFTEPDPRDDLSGLDIKRKIIILSRVAGYSIEPDEVTVEALLPQSCMDAETIDDFFVELDKHDSHFRSLIEEAHAKSAKLRYIAVFEDGKAAIKLEMVDSSSPFYNLSSTDNMIVFYTDRYNNRPLVIQGPGAGADVTAAGVFAEIIQLGTGRD